MSCGCGACEKCKTEEMLRMVRAMVPWRITPVTAEALKFIIKEDVGGR